MAQEQTQYHRITLIETLGITAAVLLATVGTVKAFLTDEAVEQVRELNTGQFNQATEVMHHALESTSPEEKKSGLIQAKEGFITSYNQFTAEAEKRTETEKKHVGFLHKFLPIKTEMAFLFPKDQRAYAYGKASEAALHVALIAQALEEYDLQREWAKKAKASFEEYASLAPHVALVGATMSMFFIKKDLSRSLPVVLTEMNYTHMRYKPGVHILFALADAGVFFVELLTKFDDMNKVYETLMAE